MLYENVLNDRSKQGYSYFPKRCRASVVILTIFMEMNINKTEKHQIFNLLDTPLKPHSASMKATKNKSRIKML